MVSVKFRLGMNGQKIVVVEFAKICEESVADMITTHWGTSSLMYEDEPLYQYKRIAKESVNTPVFANDLINSIEKEVEMMEKTKNQMV